MAWRVTDQLITERVQRYLYPGERLYVQAFAQERPSLGWFFLVGWIASFFIRQYALGVKETGLIVTQLHTWGLGEREAFIIPWNSIFHVTYTPGTLQDILAFATPDGRQWALRFGKVWGLTHNREAGRLLGQYVYGWSTAAQQHRA